MFTAEDTSSYNLLQPPHPGTPPTDLLNPPGPVTSSHPTSVMAFLELVPLPRLLGCQEPGFKRANVWDQVRVREGQHWAYPWLLTPG